MLKSAVLFLGTIALLAFVPAAAQADWFEDFEAYEPGSGLHGQGGWMGWNEDPAADAYVSIDYAHGGMQSAVILGTSDIVQEYAGYTTGIWEYVAWMYIPGNFAGQTYFIMLNTYVPNGTNNWSVQVDFDSADGMVTADQTDPAAALPMITDQWVELKLLIDLDNDLQTFYYNSEMLYEASWTDGVSGGGVLNIGAVDLYGNSASPVYYDDMMLQPAGVATEQTSWSQIKGMYR
jgi:hypothetical protein